MLALLAAIIGGVLYLAKRTTRVCPRCGESGTFGSADHDEVCSNCGLDVKTDDY